MSRTPEQTRERAAELLMEVANERRHGCESSAGVTFCCDDCPAEGGRKQCAAEHAELVELVVELRRPAAIDMELERAGRAT